MTLAADLEAYLAERFGTPTRVTRLARLAGAGSRETFSFDAETDGVLHKLILRRPRRPAMIAGDLEGEHRTQAAFHRLRVPSPEPLFLEPGGGGLGSPFMITRRLEGGRSAPLFAAAPYAPFEETLGRQVFMLLGVLSRADPGCAPPAARRAEVVADSAWRAELDWWEEHLDREEIQPSPLARAAIRRLRSRPPPPAQRLCALHGDYRSGNILHDGRGRLVGLVNWQMAHVGDPLEDLAWAIDPLWRHEDPHRAAGLVSREAAIQYWREGSGLSAEADALAWWELFSAVKGYVMATSAARAFREGGGEDPVLGLLGLYGTRAQEWALSRTLERLLDGTP